MCSVLGVALEESKSSLMNSFYLVHSTCRFNLVLSKLYEQYCTSLIDEMF